MPLCFAFPQGSHLPVKLREVTEEARVDVVADAGEVVEERI